MERVVQTLSACGGAVVGRAGADREWLPESAKQPARWAGLWCTSKEEESSMILKLGPL